MERCVAWGRYSSPKAATIDLRVRRMKKYLILYICIINLAACYTRPKESYGLNIIDITNQYNIEAIKNATCSIGIIDNISITPLTSKPGTLLISNTNFYDKTWTMAEIRKCLITSLPKVLQEELFSGIGVACNNVKIESESDYSKYSDGTIFNVNTNFYNNMSSSYYFIIEKIQISEQIEIGDKQQLNPSDYVSGQSEKSLLNFNLASSGKYIDRTYEAGIVLRIYQKMTNTCIFDGIIWIDKSRNQELDIEILTVFRSELQKLFKIDN